MADRQRPKVGEILVRSGVIDEQQLKSALGEQTRWGGHLGSTLIKLGFVEEKDLVRALASQLDLPMATLEGKRIPPEVLALVPREVADRERVMPLFVKREGGRVFLYVGVEDPGNLEAFDDLAFRTGMLIKPVMVAPSELYEAIDRCYHRAAADEATPKPASVVTPGTEELARHWSQSAQSSETTSPMAEPGPAPPAPSVVMPVPEPSPTTDAVFAPPSVPAAEPGKPSLALVVAALSSLLIEKGVMTRGEFDERIRDLALARQRGD